jgi:VCBS repeat-containing protein
MPILNNPNDEVPATNGLVDGETFSLGVANGTPVIFELNNTDVNSTFNLNHLNIDFDSTTTMAQLAARFEVAIRSAGLGLEPRWIENTGIIEIPNTQGFDFDERDLTTLSRIGSIGIPGSVPIYTYPFADFDETQVAVAVRNAFVRQETLQAVEVKPNQGNELVITGLDSDRGLLALLDTNAVFINDPATRYIPSIKDLATNELQANLLSGETKFTIQLGAVPLDYGDAPEILGDIPRNQYPTLTGSDPAAHVLTTDGMTLGERVDRDSEGQAIGFQFVTLIDGDLFTISDQSRTVTFEFDNNNDLFVSDAVAISFTTIDQAALQLAAADLVQEINNAGFGVNAQQFNVSGTNDPTVMIPTNLDVDLAGINGTLSYSGYASLGDDFDGESYQTDSSSNGFTVTAQSIIVNAPQNINDGDWFRFSNGTVENVFEFNELEFSDSVSDSMHVRIDYNAEQTADDVVEAIIAAIEQNKLSTDAALNLNPVNRGNGEISLSGDDEDGVDDRNNFYSENLIGPFSEGQMSRLQITASGNGLLDAWIDFNRDGDWDDLGEQIFASQQLLAGQNNLNIMTPEIDTEIGTSFARFRISESGGLLPTDIVPNGEIEDYQVEIVAANAPVANDDSYTWDLGTDYQFNTAIDGLPGLLANDSDADGDAMRVYAVNDTVAEIPGTPLQNIGTEGGALVVTVNSDWTTMGSQGDFTYSAEADEFKQLADGQVLTDTFTYRLREDQYDGAFQSQTDGVVTVTLIGTNEVPVAQAMPAAPDELIVFEDGNPIIYHFEGTDIDSDNDRDTLTYEICTPPADSKGTVNANQNGTFIYSTNEDFQYLSQDETELVTFDYKAIDRHDAESPCGTVTITVTGTNDAPTAEDDIYSVTQDSVYTENAAGVLANDENGRDLQDIETVIELNGLSLSNTSDPDIQSRSITTELGATFTLRSDGSFEYDGTDSDGLKALAPGEVLSETVQYKISDPYGETDDAEITITVTGVNNPPEANWEDPAQPDKYQTNQFDVMSVNTDDGVLVNDRDLDPADTPTVNGIWDDVAEGYILTGFSTKGATVNMSIDGAFEYDPATAAEISGLNKLDADVIDTFEYQITDGLLTDTAVVEITISPENMPPIANEDNFEGLANVNFITSPSGVLDNDTDPDYLGGCSISGHPHPECLFVTGINDTSFLAGESDLGAEVTFTPFGVFQYDPSDAEELKKLSDGEIGEDTFRYGVADVDGGVSSGLVTVTITGVNDAPTARNISESPRQDESWTTIVFAESQDEADASERPAFDVDSEISLIEIVDQTVLIQETGGEVIVNGNEIEYQTANNGYHGIVSFTYRVIDDLGLPSNVATVELNINNPPVANDDAFLVYKDAFGSSTSLAVLQNDEDLDGSIPSHKVEIVVDSENGTAVVNEDGTVTYPTQNGTVVANEDGTVTYTPDADLSFQTLTEEKPDSFSYQVKDDDGKLSELANVDITIKQAPPWQNQNPLDVNDDGCVSPIDALIIINKGYSEELSTPDAENGPPPYYDVNGDNWVSPIDAHTVITVLNDPDYEIECATPEGEFSGPEGEFVEPTAMDISEVAQQTLDLGETHANNGFAVDNLQTTGLSQVRSEILEELISDIADEVSGDSQDSLDDFFGQF